MSHHSTRGTPNQQTLDFHRGDRRAMIRDARFPKVVRTPRGTVHERRLRALLFEIERQGGACHETQRALADTLGCSEDTIKRSVYALQNVLKVLCVEPEKGGWKNWYQIAWDDLALLSAAPARMNQSRPEHGGTCHQEGVMVPRSWCHDATPQKQSGSGSVLSNEVCETATAILHEIGNPKVDIAFVYQVAALIEVGELTRLLVGDAAKAVRAKLDQIDSEPVRYFRGVLERKIGDGKRGRGKMWLKAALRRLPKRRWPSEVSRPTRQLNTRDAYEGLSRRELREAQSRFLSELPAVCRDAIDNGKDGEKLR